MYRTDIAELLTGIPSFCSHEHWGSIDAIGMAPEGFRPDTEQGALPKRPVSVLDVVLDPYLGGWVFGAGDDFHAAARDAGYEDVYRWFKARPRAAWDSVAGPMERQRTTGAYQCIRRGILSLYGVDIRTADGAEAAGLDRRVEANYRRMFEWYREAMGTAGLTDLVRPVHPVFFFRESDRGATSRERALMRPIMRVDPFMDMWKEDCPDRDTLAECVGVRPEDADSWRGFLERVFEASERHGNVGTKQLQAYSRPLDFPRVEDGAVTWRGDLGPGDVVLFQNWVMNECLRLTDERGWPHQCHTGTHNLPDSNPLPLREVAGRYRRTRFVLLHCWPYLAESGWLAKHCPNVYLDACWQTVLNPAFLRDALETWLGYVPVHKITMGHDATSVEMAAGSVEFVRETLGEVLPARSAALGIGRDDFRPVAAALMHDNAAALYGSGGAGNG